MQIKVETANFDVDWFEEPWMIRVNFRENKNETSYISGEWTGENAYNDQESLLRIEAEPGEYISIGQNAGCPSKISLSSAKFSVVKNDGTLDEIGCYRDAYMHYLRSQDIARIKTKKDYPQIEAITQEIAVILSHKYTDSCLIMTENLLNKAKDLDIRDLMSWLQVRFAATKEQSEEIVELLNL